MTALPVQPKQMTLEHKEEINGLLRRSPPRDMRADWPPVRMRHTLMPPTPITLTPQQIRAMEHASIVAIYEHVPTYVPPGHPGRDEYLEQARRRRERLEEHEWEEIETALEGRYGTPLPAEHRLRLSTLRRHTRLTGDEVHAIWEGRRRRKLAKAWRDHLRDMMSKPGTSTSGIRLLTDEEIRAITDVSPFPLEVFGEHADEIAKHL